MTSGPLLHDFGPCVAYIAIGYVLARFARMSAASLRPLMRFVLAPLLLFVLLLTRVEPKGFAIMAGLGAATVGVGWLLVTYIPRLLRRKVDPVAAVPNILCFTLPILALGWTGVGLGTAAAMFVGAALVGSILEERSRAPMALVTEPWLWAVALAFAVKFTHLPIQTPYDMVLPLATAAFPIALVFVGASMHPFGGFTDPATWMTVVVRYIGGIGVAAAAILVLPMSHEVKEAVAIVAVAPPASALLTLSSANSMRATAHMASIVGVITSVALIVALDVLVW